MPVNTDKAILSVRPEDIQLAAPADGLLLGQVTFIRDLGGTIETFVSVNGHQLVSVATPRDRPMVTAGQEVGLVLAPEQCVVLKK